MYKRRREIVEPRFGYLKHSLGVRRFLRRGLEKVRAEWTLGVGEARAWGLPEGTKGRALWLEQPDAVEGAVRLVQFDPVSPLCATDGARPYDHGLVKNLDFFTDDVEGAYGRFTAAGHRFLAPPVSYPVGWGGSVIATEAHLPTADGVKFSLARIQGAPRKAFGNARQSSVDDILLPRQPLHVVGQEANVPGFGFFVLSRLNLKAQQGDLRF